MIKIDIVSFLLLFPCEQYNISRHRDTAPKAVYLLLELKNAGIHFFRHSRKSKEFSAKRYLQGRLVSKNIANRQYIYEKN
jgi:hypothetical protein